MDSYKKKLQNMFKREDFAEWTTSIAKASRYRKKVMVREFFVNQCNYATWISIGFKEEKASVIFYCTDDTSSALYHIMCEHLSGKSSKEIGSITLWDFKDIIEYFDNPRKQDFQRVLNYIKRSIERNLHNSTP